MGSQKPKVTFIYIPGKFFITQAEMLKIRNNIEALQTVSETIVVSKYGAEHIDSTIKVMGIKTSNGIEYDLEKALLETEADIIILALDLKYIPNLEEKLFLNIINLLSKHLLIRLVTLVGSLMDDWSGLFFIRQTDLKKFIQDNDGKYIPNSDFMEKLWIYTYDNKSINPLQENVKIKTMVTGFGKSFLV